MDENTPAPVVRPGVDDYTPEIAAIICERLADGEALRTICRDASMPQKSTVYLWITRIPKFADLYARAREDQADSLADDILEISEDGTNDWMEKQSRNGETYIGLNREAIERSRLRMDARKWIASKLKPKKYGDKIEATVVPGGSLSELIDKAKSGA